MLASVVVPLSNENVKVALVRVSMWTFGEACSMFSNDGTTYKLVSKL